MVRAAALLISLLSLAALAAKGEAAERMAFLRSPYDDLFRDAVFSRTPPSSEERGEIIGGILPHHSLASGVIERFYARVASERGRVHRVWLLAPDHFRRGRADISTTDASWETSARLLEADPLGVAALTATGIARDDPFLFEREHGVTIHIPAIARCFPEARVVPLVPHWRFSEQAMRLAERALARACRPGDIFLLSMDFSHGKPPLAAAEEDGRSVAAIRSFDWRTVRTCDVDAAAACALFLRVMKSLGARDVELIERTDSTALGGEEDACTSYASILLRKQRGKDKETPIDR